MKSATSPATEKLDAFALDIEFLLISVVQGMALSVLASNAVAPIATMQWHVFPYIISGFLVIIIFWAQTIVHALSFIDWPLDLAHSFFYFLMGFVQVFTFSNISDPHQWFVGMSLFFVVAEILYWLDFRLIAARKANFRKSPAGSALYKHIEHQHLFEMRYLVPAGIVFNIGAVWVLQKFPTLFMGNAGHLGLISVQFVFLGCVLANAMQSFKKRAVLIKGALE